ncbi:MAG: hypothetical protein HZB16_14830 [Armatimonadetes bacterium]|nr:hypothetical protein [Armatimonadota bacterium]
MCASGWRRAEKAGIVWRTIWPVLVGLVLLVAAGRPRRPRPLAPAALVLGLLAVLSLAAAGSDDRWCFRLWPYWRWAGGPLLMAGWCGIRCWVGG